MCSPIGLLASRFRLLVLMVHLALLLCMAQGNSNNNHMSRLDREWKATKSKCELNECKHLRVYENENCVNRCISEKCYLEVYGAQPLEDGEFDNVRGRQFTQCLRQELREMKAAEQRSKAQSAAAL